MSCSNSAFHYAGEEVKKLTPAADAPFLENTRKITTIGEHLDRRIQTARKNVEDLCIAKAKLEALNVLDHPIDLYHEMLF